MIHRNEICLEYCLEYQKFESVLSHKKGFIKTLFQTFIMILDGDWFQTCSGQVGKFETNSHWKGSPYFLFKTFLSLFSDFSDQLWPTLSYYSRHCNVLNESWIHTSTLCWFLPNTVFKELKYLKMFVFIFLPTCSSVYIEVLTNSDVERKWEYLILIHKFKLWLIYFGWIT